MTRDQIISSLFNCSELDSDRLNDRLQQCNVRIIRTDGSVERTFDIRTTYRLALSLKSDPTIKDVEYQFNQKWIPARA